MTRVIREERPEERLAFPDSVVKKERASQSLGFLLVIVLAAASYAALRIYHPSATNVHWFLSHDLYKYYYEMYCYASEQILSGAFPLWNPWQACGEPFMATHQVGLFYPLNIVYLATPTHVAMGLALVVHLAMAGIFTYFCARNFDISPYGSSIAAMTFMFAGHMTYHIGEPSNLYCAAWTPLMLYMTMCLCERPSLAKALSLGLLSTLQFMAGYEQHYVYTLYLMLGYVVYYGSKSLTRHKGLVTSSRVAGYLFLAAVLTIGLSAVQLLPTLEMFLLSARTGPTLSESQLVGDSVLRFLGNLTGYETKFRNFLMSFLDPSRGMMPYSYAGLLPVLVLPFAFRNKGRRGHAVFLVIMILFCSMVSLTEWGGWAWVLRIPTIGLFRGLYRILFITALCLGLLAGMALDELSAGEGRRVDETTERSRPRRLIFPISIVALWPAIWVMRDHGLRTVLLILCFAVLLAFLWRARTRIEIILCKALVLMTLLVDLASGSFKPTVFPLRNPLIFNDFDHVWEWISSHQGRYRSYFQFVHLDANHMNIADKYGQLKKVPTIADYEPFISGKLGQYMARVQNKPFPPHIIFYGRFSGLNPKTARLKLLSAMGVRYFVVRRPYIFDSNLAPGQSDWWFSPPESFTSIYEGSEVHVLENPLALPRSFVVHSARFVKEPDKILQLLDSESFDPSREVILSTSPSEPAMAAPAPDPVAGKRSDVIFLRDDPERVDILVRSSHRGFLVLLDSYYPGWEATVNGEKTEIYEANFLFRAIPIKGGQNDISFQYRPASFKWGLRITAATSLVCIVSATMIFVDRMRKET